MMGEVVEVVREKTGETAAGAGAVTIAEHAPGTENSHAAQLVEPFASAMRPASHTVHACCPEALVNEPRGPEGWGGG